MKLTAACKVVLALLTLWVDPARTFHVRVSRSTGTCSSREAIELIANHKCFAGNGGEHGRLLQSRLVSRMSNSNIARPDDTQTSTIDDNDLPGQSKKGVYQIKTEQQYK
jgi:hypothetical protein